MMVTVIIILSLTTYLNKYVMISPKNSNLIYLFLIISFTFLSCDKTDRLKRNLNGKYTIEKFGLYCDGNNLYEITNPGIINFTGKKTIQGQTDTQTKTYIGYFEYEYNTTDINGKPIVQTEDEIFIYAFSPRSTGDFDTTVVELTYKKIDYELSLIKDSKDKIKKFQYSSGVECYFEHVVDI